jgi:hypothetical protein
MLAGSLAFAFLGTSIVANSYSHKFLRRYFALAQTQLPSLGKASSKWRGAKVEFKRGLSQDDVKTGNVEEQAQNRLPGPSPDVAKFALNCNSAGFANAVA